MKQYLDLLQNIAENGTDKPGARENMPGTTSLFGPQIEVDLKDGFPLLTTKKMYWKGIVVELLWFLTGDTNIKYLIDNGCNIWNEDAYSYYCKVASQNLERQANSIYMGIDFHGLRTDPVSTLETASYSMYTFEEFIDVIKEQPLELLKRDFSYGDYILGDCGFQYGRVWREWGQEISISTELNRQEVDRVVLEEQVDQLVNVITSLRFNPESRRHLVTAIDPANDKNLALYWCHALFQFNARPIDFVQRAIMFEDRFGYTMSPDDQNDRFLDSKNIPKYYLDCKLYQRSADVILGVPFNIASYALLTNMIAAIVGMIPGRFIHSFGDVHIYRNHIPAFLEQREREPYKLPDLKFSDEFLQACKNIQKEGVDKELFKDLVNNILESLELEDFVIQNYKSHPKIHAELSTGMK